MKKVVSLFMAVLMIFSVAAPSFAVSANELAEAAYASDVNAGSTPDDAITDAIEGVVDFFTNIFNKIINFFKKLFGLDNGVGKYKIVFDTDGGNTMKPITVAAGDEIPSPDIPVKPGHTFIGWSPALPEIMPKYDLEVKALWSVNKYTITFDSDDGSYVEPITQSYGTLVEAPSSPVKSGYEFKGWYNENGDLVSFPHYMPAYNAEYTARWVLTTYSIVFKKNAGDSEAYHTIKGKMYQEAIKESEKPADPTLDGYTFVGWDHQIPKQMPAKNMEIIAVWAENDYTVSFVADGKTLPGFPVTDKYGTVFSVPSAPAKEGHTFLGWSDKVNGTPVTVSSSIRSDVTYYAQYTPKSYTVTWNINGETVRNEITYGSNIPLPTVGAEDGYTFKGWDKTVPTKMPAEDLYFTAQFEAKDVTITFVNAVTGAKIKEITQKYGTSVTAPSASMEGYSFTGWNPQVPSKMPANDLTVEANFRINQYIITFKDTGDVTYPAIKQNYGTEIYKVKNPVKVGHTFLNWDVAIPSTMPAENLTITAQWKVNQYTVTFDTNGGTAIAPVTQNYGTALKAPATPVKSDYEFIGWAKVANPSVDDKVSLPSTVPAEDVTYYAIWRGAEKTVVFNANKGKFDTTVAGVEGNGSKYTNVIRNGENLKAYLDGEYEIDDEKFPEITRENMAILYWSSDSSFKADMSNKVPDTFELSASTESVEYWAQWTTAYKITIYDGKTVIKETLLPAGKDLSEILNIDEYAAEKRKGYTFDHWEWDDKDGNRVEAKPLPQVMPEDNLVLYATWSANEYEMVFNAGEGKFDETTGSVHSFKEKYNVDITAKLPDANRPEKPEDFEEGKIYVPVREGFVFEGWTTEEGIDYADAELLIEEGKLEGKLVKNLPKKMPVDGATYYAVWTRLVSTATYVVLNEKGDSYITYEFDVETEDEVGDVTKEHKTAVYETKYGTAIEIPEIDPERKGYEFIGWFDTKKAEGGNAAEDVAMPAKDITFYARMVKTYSFNFANCGNVETITAKPGDSVIDEIKALEPTKKGHAFKGWRDADGKFYANNSALASAYPNMTDKDMTFVAEWDTNSYTIKFNSNGGSKIDSITLPFGAIVEAPAAPTRTGYTFEAWVDGNGNNVSIPETMPEGGFECTAKWKVNAYTITFDAVDGKFADGQSKVLVTLNYGEEIREELIPEAPEKYGYKFTSWSSVPATMPANDITVTANYVVGQFIAKFFITPEDEENNVAYSEKGYNYGAEIKAPVTPARKGYDFIGWSLIWSKGDPNDVVELGTINADVSFYAVWVPKKVTIKFVRINPVTGKTEPIATTTDNWCSDTTTYPVTDGTKYSADNKGVMRNYTLYWKVTVDGKEILIKHGDDATPCTNSSTLTYTETWVVDTVSIDFNTNGGSTIAKRLYDSGDRISAPAVPTKAGYDFVKWVLDDGIENNNPKDAEAFQWKETDEDGNELINGVRIYESVKLEAVWTEAKFDVIWNVDGVKTKETYLYGAKIKLPDEPTKTGYTFAGWTPAVSETMGAADVVYTATWTPNEYIVTFYSGEDVDGTWVGGSWANDVTMKTVKATFGETINPPVAPTRTGYTFGGWTPAVGTMDEISKSFVAIWNAAGDTKYVVKTHKMNLEGEYETTTVELSGATGAEVEATYTLDKGFVLNTEKSKGKTSGKIKADGSLVLEVYLDRVDIKVTINGNTQTYLYGQTISEPALPAGVEKECFKGWYMADTNTEVVFPIVALKDTVIIPKVKSYSIYFMTEGGDDVAPLNNIDVYTDLYSVIEKIVATKDGYTFKGWTDNKDTNVVITAGSKKMPNNNLNLYAVWEENKTEN